jgi:low temperature requirement protein LtrA
MVELFFDLIFVFAITQLSHHLMEHFTPAGALETGVLAFAVWWVWIYTTWAMNWLDPGRIPVRLCLFGLMLAGVVLSASIPEALGGRGLAFGAAYATMQVGRGAFVAWAMRAGSLAERRNFQRIVVWLAVSGCLWVAGGLADPHQRLFWWAGALGLELLGPWVGFRVPGIGRSTTSDWQVEGHHMAERCGLFVIIALGETLLVTGATFAGLAWTPTIVAAMAIAFVGTAAMWWLYFDVAHDVGTRYFAGAGDTGRVARFTYTYMHVPIVLGMIVLAAADEFVMAHPAGHVDDQTRWAIVAGSGLYLVGNLLFRWGFSGYWSRMHLAGLLVLPALYLAAEWTAPWGLLGCSSLLLLTVAVLEGWAWRRETAPGGRHAHPDG